MSTKVLVSRGFGAGWSTWNTEDGTALATDVGLVSLVEEGASPEVLRSYVGEVWPEAYDGGVADLYVVEVPAGALWRLSEYDGSESLEVLNTDNWNMG